MFIDNGGLHLHVTDDGDPTGPPVLFLHGILSGHRTWDWMVSLLSERHRVLRLDFRGHGRSGRVPGSYGMADYLTDAVAVCEQVIGRSATVVGHSLGGGTAAALAQRRPDLVAALVLEDPGLLRGSEELDGHALVPAFDFMVTAIPAVQAMNLPLEQLVAQIGTLPTPQGPPTSEVFLPDAIVAMAQGILDVDVHVLDPVKAGTLGSAFDALAPLPVPTIVMAADPAMPGALVNQRDRDRLAQHSPHVEVRTVVGAGHLIHDAVAHRPEFTAAVLEMLARQG